MLSACSTTPQPLPIDLPEPQKAILPLPNEIQTETVFIEVTEDGDVVLTAEEFQIMMDNIAEIYRWVREARFQLDYYRSDENNE